MSSKTRKLMGRGPRWLRLSALLAGGLMMLPLWSATSPAGVIESPVLASSVIINGVLVNGVTVNGAFVNGLTCDTFLGTAFTLSDLSCFGACGDLANFEHFETRLTGLSGSTIFGTGLSGAAILTTEVTCVQTCHEVTHVETETNLSGANLSGGFFNLSGGLSGGVTEFEVTHVDLVCENPSVPPPAAAVAAAGRFTG